MYWTRYELKSQAKKGLRNNYWPSFLATIITTVTAAGLAGIVTFFQLLPAAFSGALFNPHFAVNYLAVTMPFLGIYHWIITIFIIGPLYVGCRYLFITALRGRTSISYVGRGFSHNYLRNVSTIFLRDIFIFLWSLLLVIPGIIKAYEYLMVPYIIADDPNIDRRTAFRLSAQMMYGNKLNAFVLSLSFIGWELLSALTFGVLELFYVGPYRELTYAALYEKLKNKTNY